MSNRKRNKFKSKSEGAREEALRRQIKREMYDSLLRDTNFRDGVRDLLDESRPAWTPFEEVTSQLSSPLMRQLGISDPMLALRQAWGPDYKDVRVFQNSRYFVFRRPFELPGEDGPVRLWQLSIKDLENTARHDWRDFQRIKNELCGPECEACEVYPAESRLVDTSNQFYLWVLPGGKRFPFGFEERAVVEIPGHPGTRQRRFEPDVRPDDLVEPSLDDDIARLKWLKERMGDGEPGQAQGGQGEQDDRAQAGGQAQAEDRSQAEGQGEVGG
jgi:hypothetical protein